MKRNGFTLIELLIVVAIIGILAAIAVPNFMNARLKATLTRVQADMVAFEKAYEMYRLDKNSFPPHVGSHPSWQNKYVTTPVAYLPSIPKDPFQQGMGERLDLPMAALNYTHGEFHVDPCPGGRVIQDPALYQRAKNCTTVWAISDFSSTTVSYFWSPGPNREHDSSSNKLYMLSNGLISEGDLVRLVGP
ncbi:MAG: prepilin-type N-terminal cleavage/methylation domain-containing protein [bacterium]